MLVHKAASSHWLSSRRINISNKHGTGCTLSAAIAANLARNNADLIDAVITAKNYLTLALTGARELDVGTGSGPLHHFIDLWR